MAARGINARNNIQGRQGQALTPAQLREVAFTLQDLLERFAPHQKDNLMGDLNFIAGVVSAILNDNVCNAIIDQEPIDGQNGFARDQYEALLIEMDRVLGGIQNTDRLRRLQNVQGVRHRTGDAAFATAVMNVYNAGRVVRQPNAGQAVFGRQALNIYNNLLLHGREAELPNALENLMVRGAQNQALRRQNIVLDLMRVADAAAAPIEIELRKNPLWNAAVDVWANAPADGGNIGDTPGQGERNVSYLLILIKLLRCNMADANLRNVTAADIESLLDLLQMIFTINPVTGRFRGAAVRNAAGRVLNLPWINAMNAGHALYCLQWELTPERALRIYSVFRRVCVPEEVLAAPNATVETVTTVFRTIYNNIPNMQRQFAQQYLNEAGACLDKVLIGRNNIFRIPNPDTDRRGILTA